MWGHRGGSSVGGGGVRVRRRGREGSIEWAGGGGGARQREGREGGTTEKEGRSAVIEGERRAIWPREGVGKRHAPARPPS